MQTLPTRDELIRDFKLILLAQAQITAQISGEAAGAAVLRLPPVADAGGTHGHPDVDFSTVDLDPADMMEHPEKIPVETFESLQTILEYLDLIGGGHFTGLVDIDWGRIRAIRAALPRHTLRSALGLANSSIPDYLTGRGSLVGFLAYAEDLAAVIDFFFGGAEYISVETLARVARTTEPTIRNALSGRTPKIRSSRNDRGEVVIHIPDAIAWMAHRRHFERPKLAAMACPRSPEIAASEYAVKAYCRNWLAALMHWNAGPAAQVGAAAGLDPATMEQILRMEAPVPETALRAFATAVLLDPADFIRFHNAARTREETDAR